MPELPEVETVARALKGGLIGRSIVSVEIFSPKLRTPITPLATADLPGRRFTEVLRRGRYLILKLDNDTGLLVHLGMSGVIRIEEPQVPKRRHEHIFIHLSDGRILRFECPRRFSLFELHKLGMNGLPEVLNSLGAEPLSEEFQPETLYHASRKSRAPVKTFLMDNSVVVGVGNIYCTETLFAAGINPRRAAGSLTKKECLNLVVEVKRLLTWAIERGGSSIHDYRHVDGSEGKFQLDLNVYGKKGTPCPKCGTLLKSVKQGGRTTVFCPHCQK